MKDKLSLKEKIVQTQFELLKEHIGEEVIVERYEYGRFFVDKLVIKSVHDYDGIVFDKMYLTFLGQSAAIKRITIGNIVLYEAKGLPEPYETYDREDYIEITRTVFGEHEAMKLAESFKKSDEYFERRDQEENEYVTKFKNELLPALLIQSKPFIIEDKYEEWEKACGKVHGYYGIAVVKMTIEVLVLLNSGKSLNEALDIVGKKYRSTGYSDSCVITNISKYAKSGREVKREWNSEYGDENIEGVINPAVIHIGTKRR